MVGAGHLVGGRFRIEARVGAGGGGVVYRAFDELERSPVALKIRYRSSLIDQKRFEREIRILSETIDPRVARYVAHGADPDAGEFLAMEWLEGETLSAWIERETLTIGDAIDVGIVLADTLGRLHARGVVHRDLKPSNVFLVDRDIRRIKLLDFGIARTDASTIVTATGGFVGTIGYMSPEQVRGDGSLDQRSDVFSLGCLLFQCVTGTLPFDTGSATQWLVELALSEPARANAVAPHVPEDLSDVLDKMLQKAVIDRYSSMGEVSRALRAVAPVRGDAPRSGRAPAITRTESRFVSVLLFGDERRELGSFLAEEVSLRGGVLYESPDGQMLVTFEAAEAPSDLARSAARLGLAIADTLHDAKLVVLSARVTNERGRFNDAIGRAAALLSHAGGGVVVVDEASRGLLRGSFACEPLDAGSATGGATTDARAFALIAESPSRRGAPPSAVASPFVGRERELATILDGFEHAISDSAAEVVLVLGGAGVGKSRLLSEAHVRIAAAPTRPTILVGSAEDAERTASFGLIRSMLRRFLGVPAGRRDPARARAAVREQLARWIDESVLDLQTDFVCELLLLPSSPQPSAALYAARADPRLMTDQLTRAVELLLRGIRSRSTVVIVVEYLHWADGASLTLLDRFLASSAQHRVFVLGTGRPETQERFPNLFADRSVTTIRLRELLPRAALHLARSIVPVGTEDTLVARIVELGGGNPLFIEELSRAVREGHGGALPDSILALSQERLDRLDDRQRRLLRAASVFGQRFPHEGVAALLAGDYDAEAFDELCRSGAIRRDDSAQPADHAFASLILREVAYASVPKHELAGAHRRAARFLEGAGDTRALQLAFHFELGQVPDRAAAWYLRAARQALAANALADAAKWANKALDLDASDAAAGAALTLCAEVEDSRWAWTDAARHATSAMDRLPEGNVLWFIAAHVLTRAHVRTERIDEFLRLVERLRRTDPAPGAHNAAVLALAGASNSLAIAGQLDVARETMRRVDLLDRELPEGASAKASATLARGGIALASGDLGAYRTLRFEAAERFERLSDWRKAIEVRGTAAYADALLGRYEAALAGLDGCVFLAIEHGMSTVHYLRHNVGLVLLQLGRLEAARTTLEATLAPLRATSPHLERGSRRYLARVLVGLGELDLAEEHARAALDSAERPAAKRAGLADVAHVLLAKGRAADARDLAEASARDLPPHGAFDESEMFLRLTVVRARASAGDAAAARSAALEAHERLLGLAAKIEDTAMRESFLVHVPEHAAITKLASELAGA